MTGGDEPRTVYRATRQAAAEKLQKGVSMLDKVVWLCVVMGVIVTVAPLTLWAIRAEPIADSYFQYVFHFWGGELLGSVAVYAIKIWGKLAGNKDAASAPEQEAGPGDTGAGG